MHHGQSPRMTVGQLSPCGRSTGYSPGCTSPPTPPTPAGATRHTPRRTTSSSQFGDSLVQSVRYRRRLSHGSGEHFPGHGTKTTFVLPNHLATCGISLGHTSARCRGRLFGAFIWGLFLHVGYVKIKSFDCPHAPTYDYRVGSIVYVVISSDKNGNSREAK